MKPARDIIAGLFNAADGPVADVSDWLPSQWPLVAGDALAACTRAAGLRNGILYVEVAGPEWVEQLKEFEPELRRRLNQRAGRAALRRIVFRPGRFLPSKPPMRAMTASGREEGSVADPMRRAAYERSKRLADRR
ncbi:MAG: DUF721 domain-containing protein [Acidobacteria bacterium]|nr:DUF721 domain-containing protein [Acidobacteriota bacterium]